MPQAQPAAARLIERLNVLLGEKNRNPFALSALKKEAQVLLKTDAFHAYVVLGMIACLEKNVDEMHKNHLKALNLYPNDPLANNNYAASLANLGFNSEASKQYRKAYQLEPANLNVLSGLIDTLTFAGRVHEARKLLINDWKKKSPSSPYKGEGLVMRLAEFLDKQGISDDESARIENLATAYLSAEGLFKIDEGLSLANDDGAKWIQHIISVGGSVDQVAELNCGFADRVSKEIPTKVMKSITVLYSAD